MPRPAAFVPAMQRALAGREARILERCASTNDEAREWARTGAPHLAVVVADAQESGRGRRGRGWLADPGEALLCSIVLRPTLVQSRWTMLPLVAGVATAEAVEERTGVTVQLKWPNDLVIGERKLGGILCEADPPDHLVCGLGINVSRAPAGVAATALADLDARRLDRADLLAAILTHFEGALLDVDGAMERYRQRSATLGMIVRIVRIDGSIIEGSAVAIDDDGALEISFAEGFSYRVDAGEVEHLRPAG